VRTRGTPNFQRNLAHMITLADGWQVKSLHDARELLLDVFGSVSTRSGALDHAIGLLVRAAETGKRADTTTATDAIERLLRERRLL